MWVESCVLLFSMMLIVGNLHLIIVVECAKPEVAIGFREYFRIGLQLTLATLTVGIAGLSKV